MLPDAVRLRVRKQFHCVRQRRRPATSAVSAPSLLDVRELEARSARAIARRLEPRLLNGATDRDPERSQLLHRLDREVARAC